jgi:transitional endoplasmic reticulum ATPase
MILSINDIIDNYQIDRQIGNNSAGPAYREVYAVHYVPSPEDADRLYSKEGYAYLVAYRTELTPKGLLREESGEVAEFELCRQLVGRPFFHFVRSGRLEREGGEVRWMIVEQNLTTSNDLTLHDSPKITEEMYGHDLLMRLRDLPGFLFEDGELWYLIFEDLLEGVKSLSSRLHSGGHYNLTPDNIWVELKSSEEIDNEGIHVLSWRYKKCYIVGLAFAAEPCIGSTPFDQKYLDPLYRARETFLGRYSFRTDIYSLGLVLAFILHGKFPVEVPEHLEGMSIPKYIYHNLPDCSGATKFPVMEIVRKAISPKISERYASLDEFHDAVQRLHDKLFAPDDYEESDTYPPFRKAVEALRRSGETRHLPIISDEGPGPDDLLNFSLEAEPESRLNLKLKVLHGEGFKAVAGMEELKKKLRRDFIDIIGHRELAKQYDIVPPNLLLIGPPGTGKTYLSTRLAEECGMECSIIKPSDLGSIFVHGSQNMIKQLFEKAEKQARANHKGVLLVFDEFDAFCPKRTFDDHNSQSGEVAEFLTQLNDCIEKNIYVVGTTNFPDRIDRAVIRKGRIDEVIYIGMPDDLCREQLFEYELAKRPHDETIDLKKLVRLTAGYNSSDIAYLVKESARCAFEATLAQENLEKVSNITQELLEEQIRNTSPSVSSADMRRYERMRDEFTHKENESRYRIGFK